MNKTFVYIGSHNHTPHGSSEERFERDYTRFYKPFIVALYKFPAIPVVLHYSGPLLAWLEEKHPEFISILRDLVNRKQVEILGGGFYEPLFSVIPLSDRIGQIEMMTTYLRQQFGKRPRGCWLPGLVWEPNYPQTLQACGMDYVFLGMDQFRLASQNPQVREMPCLTEDQGKIITVFPVSEPPYAESCLKDPEYFIKHLYKDSQSASHTRHLAFFLDRFQDPDVSPEIYEHRLSVLFELLSIGRDRLELTTPGRVIKNLAPLGKLYFPSSAEKKVLQWAVASANRKSMYENQDKKGNGVLHCGSTARNFLARYPEANGVYAKMMYTHLIINQLRGDKARKKAAREELWKAQSCDAFWHLGSDGIHQNRLRKAAYEALIGAEKIARAKGSFIPSLAPLDFDMDGRVEYLFQGNDVNCYVNAYGGSIFELDQLSRSWNYLDTFSRYAEAYNDDDALTDAYRRSAFLDRFLPLGTTLKDIENGAARQALLNAVDAYETLELDRTRQQLTLRSMGANGSPWERVELVKRYSLRKNEITVAYTIKNLGERTVRCVFAPEIDLSFSSPSESIQQITAKDADGQSITLSLRACERHNLREIAIKDTDRELAVSLSSSTAFNLWLLPVFSRSRIEGKLVQEYQSTCLMPYRPLSIEPQASWETVFELRLGK